MFRRILVTGGAGFIGSAVIRRIMAATESSVVNVDKLTYAGNRETLAQFESDPQYQSRYHFEQADICDLQQIKRVLSEHQPDAVMHLAAESHVDRSIDGPAAFIDTNIVGTFVLLDAVRDHWRGLSDSDQAGFRFHHISTDEVFGSLGAEGLFSETTAYQPNSPYSASKAASDHLVRAWHHTYGLPTVVSNCSNNYGPYQFPEKLIPVVIHKALSGEAIPIYGKGENVRDWLHVEDHAEALLTIVSRGVPGETYNVGGNAELSNLELVRLICKILDDVRPRSDGKNHDSAIEFVTDRPGHDLRYAIDASKIERELNWTPRHTLETGLTNTVNWYLENEKWVQSVLDGSYKVQRLGMSA